MGVAASGTRLVPTPYMVAVMMRDFAFGGVYDDAFSGTILTHLFASMQRVYGGFLLAAAIGIPLAAASRKPPYTRCMEANRCVRMVPLKASSYTPPKAKSRIITATM